MFGAEKNRMTWLRYAEKYDDTLSRFDTIPERDRQTNGQTEFLYQYRANENETTRHRTAW